MASTRASSPASDAGSAMQLTPRSKVKAMLAALDGDSDEDNAIVPRKPTSLFKKLQESTRQSPAADATQDVANEEDTEEDEDDVIRPRGRMAARMRAAEESDQDVEQSGARERVRKMLSKKAKEPTPDPGAQNDGSEDDDLPVVPRKRQARTARTPSPQSNHGVVNSQSPGMFLTPGSNERRRPSPVASVASESDEELPTNLVASTKFQELVRRKREERKAKEAELAKEKAEKASKRKEFSDMLDQEDELDASDSETGKRMTQPGRKSRKASKKALEDMKRETQRMSRNMQLAHEARTKKKITKASLFAKFNYRQPSTEDSAQTVENRPVSSSSALQSDPDLRETTPPTSPSLNANVALKRLETPLKGFKSPPPLDLEDEDGDLLSLEDALARMPKKIDKGKEVQAIPSSPPNLGLQNQTGPKIRKSEISQNDSDSDLEITYSAPKNKRPKTRKQKIDEIFDRMPTRQAQESHSLQALRLLAHLSSPGKTNKGKGAKSSMTNPELQLSLQQRIRQQAARERAEREQSLRDRGIVVLTAEEREKEMVDVEDLITRARREADDLTKKEKAEAKQERKDNGEVDPLGDSSDDEDWTEEKEQVDVELSGSDDENQLEVDDGDASGEEEDDEDAMSEDGEEKNDQPADGVSALFDNEASETESEQETGMDLNDEDEIAQASDMEEDDEIMPTAPGRRRTKNTRVLSDDEDEVVSQPITQTPATTHFATPATKHFATPAIKMKPFASPMPPKTISPVTSVLRSANKTFIPGLSVIGPAGLGLTQIFQGTMDDSQPDEYSDTTMVPETSSGGNERDSTHDSMAFLRRMPPTLPAFESTADEESQDVIMDSQPGISQVPASQPPEDVSQPIQLDFSPSQIRGFDSLDPFATQYSEFPEQTQDIGFQTRSPIKNRFASQSQATQSTVPYSTVDTVLANPAAAGFDEMEEPNSPTVKKAGRLRRRTRVPSPEEDEDVVSKEHNQDEEEGFDISANAFDVMRRAAKKKQPVIDDFDKKKSHARQMVQEQAEESEDEYAGLGGASDDESGGEEDALVKAMIDDEAGKEADERQLAAFYADKERARDTKDVEKLYKDITNGMLRRKRGGDYSLSDSEDDGEARRNQKRKEFAKMRKALLEDERIGKIAQNPKQSAFLAAIEDRDNDEFDFLDSYEDSQDTFEMESQNDTQGKDTEMTDDVQVPGSQTDTSMGPPKRKRGDESSDAENRPPPNLRRTKGKRPSNLAEIRDSLSSLMEDPNSVLDAEDSDSESDLEIVDDDEEEGSGSGTDKETRRRDSKDPFASRRNQNISVVDRISLKRSSSSNISATTKLAFAAPSTSSLYSVKVPPLLRKATSNLSTNSGISGMGGGVKLVDAAGVSGVKRGGGKTSGIAFQARETERRKKVEEGERKREKKKFKGAERRRVEVGGLFGKGKFE